MTWPNPNEKFPIPAYKGLGFLKNFIQDPNIIVGDYTYYDDPEGVENFEKNVLYRSPMIESKLIIGKFCAIATGVKFIMNAANHKIWANATVTKDVEPYSIVWWNPAKIIRYRFDQETISILQEIQWRNWNIEKITENLDIILGNDILKLRNLI